MVEGFTSFSFRVSFFFFCFRTLCSKTRTNVNRNQSMDGRSKVSGGEKKRENQKIRFFHRREEPSCRRAKGIFSVTVPTNRAKSRYSSKFCRLHAPRSTLQPSSITLPPTANKANHHRSIVGKDLRWPLSNHFQNAAAIMLMDGCSCLRSHHCR